MFAKIIGCALILIASTSAGYIAKFRADQRIKELENMLVCMQGFEYEICYNISDIIKATKNLVRISSIHNQKIFLSFLESAQKSNGKPLSEIWQETMNQKREECYFLKDDFEIISQFGSVLGCGNVDTQAKNIAILKERISKQILNLKTKSEKSGNLPAKIGIYAGLVVIVTIF